MRFGTCVPNYGLVSVSGDDLRDFSQECEGLGFDSLWVTDHAVGTPDVVSQLGPAHFDTPLALMHVGYHTRRVRLGTSVLVLPYRNPLVLARSLATIDILSGGRLELAVGSGWARQEFEALGVPFSQRGARTDEYLAIIRDLWTGERCSFHGRFFRYDDVVFEPKPLQQPRPPIWVGGSGERSWQRVIDFADGWHTITNYEASLDAGLDWLRTKAAATGRAPVRLSLRAMDLTFRERAEEVRKPFQGTADQIASDVARYDALGFEEIVLHSLRVPTAEQALQPLRRFAREIMPRFAARATEP